MIIWKHTDIKSVFSSAYVWAVSFVDIVYIVFAYSAT